MGTINDKFKEEYLSHLARGYDDAIERAKRYLHYDRNFKDNEECVKAAELMYKLLCLSDADKGSIFGNNIDGVISPYFFGYSVPDVLAQASFFVGHEILDDGEPGIGYYFVDDRGQRKMCKKDLPGSCPFFHPSIDELREFDRSAEYCDIDKALAIVDFYIERRKRLDKFNQDFKERLSCVELGDAAFSIYEDRLEEEDRKFVQFVNELKEEES